MARPPKRRRRGEPVNRSPFSSALIDARQKLDLSQADLAEAIGVEQETVSSWERGDLLPRAHRIDSIAVAVSMKPDKLRALWFESSSRRAA